MTTERRAAPRLGLSVPVTISKLDGPVAAGPCTLSTVTRNISAGGVYFSTHRGAEFETGTRVSVKILMPHHVVPVQQIASFSLTGQGTVVRVEPAADPGGSETGDGSGTTGVAVRFDECLRFENFHLV